MKIEIITQKQEWDDFLKSVNNYDFYHTYDYHHISKSESDTPVLIKYTNKDTYIGLPLLIRKIPNSEYFDAVSVYGYSGHIGSKLPDNFDTTHYEEVLLDFFKTKKIVSVFMRLNPYIKFQNILFSNLGESTATETTTEFGELTYLGKIVNINLSLPLEEQRKKYSRRLKTHINKSNKLLTVKVAETKEEIEAFKSLYYDNMKRINAKKNYFFSDDYFKKLVSSQDFKTEILLAIEKSTNKTIAAGMFIKTKKMVQYHLAGANEDYLDLNPIKFIIDKMRIKATEEGYKNFNLGGGLGANENDSLFRFKSLFSDEYHPFFVWKLVANNRVYYELCKQNEVNYTASSFFPLYRYKEHHS